MKHWYLCKLDINNAFLHGDSKEEIYIEKSSGFVSHEGVLG